MSDAVVIDSEPGGEDEEDSPPERVDRDHDILGRTGSPCRKRLTDLFNDVLKGFNDQSDRADLIDQMWDIYHCVLNENQYYNGNAQIYVPIVRDAVNARATRFVNALFPPGGNHVEAVSTDGTTPYAIVAILDHYIRTLKLKTRIAKPLSRNGDIEGQYNLYVRWDEVKRQIVSRETHGTIINEEGIDIELDDEPIEDITEEEVTEGCPGVEVLHDNDVLVLPRTADSIEDALANGGSVTIVRRWTKEMIKAKIAADEIEKSVGDDLAEMMTDASRDTGAVRNTASQINEHIGIRGGKGSHAVVWETWVMLPLGDKGTYARGGTKHLCRIFFASADMPLSCRRNPYWNDRCPLISAPVEKIAGVFKGDSLVHPIASMQYDANDAANQAADSATYAALPIVVHDPQKGNGPFILNMAAIWEAPPDSIKFMEFPDLAPRGIARIQYYTTAIFQTLGVNPSMLPQQSTQNKRNQAQVTQEQQVDLLTTAEQVAVMEEGQFTPLMGWMVDLDYQYRRTPITIRKYGAMGIHAAMEPVPPLQNRSRYEFRWWGVEAARLASQAQQQIAWMNVARGMAQDLKQAGYRLNPAPALEASARGVFDARLAPLVLIDMKQEMTVNAELENAMLEDGHDLYVHPLDNDPEHMKKHQELAKETGDPYGNVHVHMQRHAMSMAVKTQQQVQQALQQQGMGQPQAGQRPPGAPGVPGGPPQRPGVAGTPRPGMPGPPRMPQPGAQPAMPRMNRGPPGMVPPDQAFRRGVIQMPRRT